jgi:putative redox protein
MGKSMRASAQQQENLRHDVVVGSHTITSDEPREHGGGDAGPSPQELLAGALASCVAITMEMYAKRKQWDVAGLRVDVEYSPADRGHPTKFDVVMKVPAHLSEEQVEKLAVIAAKCPVHRTLEGEVAFDERVELV